MGLRFRGVGEPCFGRVDGASPAAVGALPFSTVRFWEVGRYPCLSTRGGGARAAAVERDRVRASIRPSSGANPDIPSLREHWLRTKYASRKALSCRMRGKSCRLALRAARAARCAIFTAVASYKERCWKKTGLLRAVRGRGAGDSCRSEASVHDDEATPDRSIVLVDSGTGFVPQSQLIGCLFMSGAAGPLSACLHRETVRAASTLRRRPQTIHILFETGLGRESTERLCRVDTRSDVGAELQASESTNK